MKGMTSAAYRQRNCGNNITKCAAAAALRSRAIAEWVSQRASTENTDCINAEIRIIKTIKFGSRKVPPIPVNLVESGLKVILLMREPRAVLNSRVRAGWNSNGGKELEAICRDAHAIASRVHESTLPRQQLIGIRYEDLVENTTAVVRKLAAFLGTKFGQSDWDWKRLSTFMTNAHGPAYSKATEKITTPDPQLLKIQQNQHSMPKLPNVCVKVEELWAQWLKLARI